MFTVHLLAKKIGYPITMPDENFKKGYAAYVAEFDPNNITQRDRMLEKDLIFREILETRYKQIAGFALCLVSFRAISLEYDIDQILSSAWGIKRGRGSIIVSPLSEI